MNLLRVIICLFALMLTSLPRIKADPSDIIRFVPPQPGNVFLVGEAPHFQVVAPKTRAEFKISWRLFDWRHQLKSEGKTEVVDGASFTLPKLPCGYYTVEFESRHAALAALPVAVITPPVATRDAELPFALDTGFSWLTKQNADRNSELNTDRTEAAARLVRLSGTSQVRERLRWNETNPKRDEFTWGKYNRNAALLLKHDVHLLDVFHDAPPWTKGDLVSLPRDLIALSQFAEAAARRLAPAANAWEFWNEPDTVSYCADAAWDFASAQKAAYYGFKRGNPQAVVLSSAAALLPSSFFDVVLRNTVGSSFDRFNLHLYEPVDHYQAAVEQTRRSLRGFGIDKIPIWVTEVGLAQEGSGKLAPLHPTSGAREHDFAQEIQQAIFLVKSLVTLASLGIERSFFFVLFPYNENNDAKVWGLLRWDWTVKPAYCAFSNLVSRLAGSNCSGRLNLGDGVDAFVWSAASSKTADQTVVLWSRERKKISLDGATSATRCSDLMGSEVPIVVENKNAVIETSAKPQFVTHLVGLTSSARLSPPSPTKARDNKPSPVVLSLESPAGNVKNRIAVRLTGPVKWPLTIWNLSSQEQHVALQNRSRGVAVRGLPDQVTVEPLQNKTISVELAPDSTDLDSQICFAGTNEGEEIAPVTVPIYPSLLSLQKRPRLKIAINDSRSWRANSAGKMKALSAADKDQIDFTVAFSPETSDRWIYPEFALMSSRSAVTASSGVSFEIKQKTKGRKLVKKAYLILVAEDGGKQFLPIEITPDWQQLTALWKYDAPVTFDPAKAVALQIGCNPTSDSFEYSVRNLEIISANAPEHTP